MNAVVKQMQPLVRGDDHGPGIIRTHSGRLMDLTKPKWGDISIDDIAWSLGKLVRYNGHIPWDYTVARHSIIMSYYVPEEYAMEALTHDTGEAYCGDIIHPLKRLYPDLEQFEDNITGLIMQKYNYGKRVRQNRASKHLYQKSDVVKHADILIYQHECYRFGRPGQYVPEMHNAERKAMQEVGLNGLYTHGMQGDGAAFLKRFYDLNPQAAPNGEVL